MKKNKYFIFTLGCQMNISDSQRIAQKLEDLGYKSAPKKEADLIIVNACSVRQTAVDRIWGKIKLWQEQKKRIYITGCVLPADKKKFLAKNIIFFNIKELSNLDKIIDEYSYILKNIRISSENISSCISYFDIKPKLDNKIAYIPIMTGCDNFCSYCAVPMTRGREVSRPIREILTDVKNALKNGIQEILLLGQNVNSYGKIKDGHSDVPLSGAEESAANAASHIRERSLADTRDDKLKNKDFIKLLKTVDELPNDFSFNFISSNPHDMSDELIESFSKLKKWPHELHLAMQSGDDEILKKMNRRYTANQFLKLVENLKSKIPNLKISTDIIVGFPGETKKQFENTVKICKKIGFEKAYISQYSPRPGTAAAKPKDDVPKKEKKRRWEILDKLINNHELRNSILRCHCERS